MKYDGSDDWVDLGAPPVEFGTKRLDNGNISHDGVLGTFKALYSDDTGAALATGVTAVRLTFGMQDNNKSGYGEIEAIGCSSQGWPPLAVTPLEEDFGTLTVSPAANANGYYDAGTVVNVAITVTNDVEFLMWKGHPPPGGEQSASVDITMDGIKSITASVLAPYLLYKNGKLTDGQMVMSANGETNAITVTKLSAFGFVASFVAYFVAFVEEGKRREDGMYRIAARAGGRNACPMVGVPPSGGSGSGASAPFP